MSISHFPILPLINILKINYFIISLFLSVFFYFFVLIVILKIFLTVILFYLTTILKFIIYLKINIINLIK